MDKKSFIIYQNWAEIIKRLPNEDAGELFKAICNYTTDSDYEISNPYIDALFEGQIKPQLNADDKKYQKKRERMAELNRNRHDNDTKSSRNRNDNVSDADTDTVTDTVTVSPTEIKEKDSPTESRKRKPIKKRYGAFGHVLLSDRDIELLYQNHGEMETQTAIDYLDGYIEEKGYKSKNHKMTLERWVFDAVKKKGHGDNRASSNITPFNPTEYILQQIREEEAHEQAGNEQDSSVNYSGVP